ncbi:MAG: hypothetical protein ACI4RN_04510 [Oscillospiraceae bacterium]
MAKMYTLDEKLLVGTPEIRVGGKIYAVDDRQKTAKKIIKICNKAEEEKDLDVVDEVFKLAFSSADYKEIDKMDLSFSAYQELFNLVMAAITGEDPKDLSDRFQEQKAE